ncbi:hypothetical protein OAT00_03675 [Pelagibacteraceae bacterium]|nr:hypothetical protein [Pelagibacteraceae bacterium]
MLIKKNKFWAFIPARSGSKSIKNKNILDISGKPLFFYSLEVARKVKLIDKIIFSSDSKKYIKLSKKYFKDIIIDKRLAKDATDKAIDTNFFYTFVKNRVQLGLEIPEFFIHLRPTTPLREKKIIEKSIRLFNKIKNKFSSLRSISEMASTSYKTMRIVDGKLCSIIKKDFNLDKLNLPRQNYQKTYVANGYIDIIKTENIFKKILHGSAVYPFLINGFNSDIDDIEDYYRVKRYLKK